MNSSHLQTASHICAPEHTGSLLIGGKWLVPAEERSFPTVDPATEDVLAQVGWAGAEDVNKAVFAARAALDGQWASCSASQRSILLNRLADLIEEHASDLARLESLDGGKPVRFAEKVDLPQVVDHLRYFAGWPTKIEGRVFAASVPSTFVYSRREPVGVCALITPWNFPLLIAIYKLGPALAAGCTVILKPAEQTPLSALRLGELVQEAGFPDGVVNVLTGGGDTGRLLVEHPGIDKVSFTGSTSVGREVAVGGAGTFKRVTLELGGKNPAIVLPDAAPSEVARGAYMAAYFNSGQVCQAGSRMYVHTSCFDAVVAAIAERARNAKVGPGLEPDTQIGPLVSREQYERVQSFISAGLKAGAEDAVGAPAGETPNRGYFIRPFLFTQVDEAMAIAREEVFGPVLVVMPYTELEDALRRANDSAYGLTAYIWTRDIATAHAAANRLRAGSIFINMANASDPAAPFGGMRSSGFGRESGAEALDAYLETKTVWANLA